MHLSAGFPRCTCFDAVPEVVGHRPKRTNSSSAMSTLCKSVGAPSVDIQHQRVSGREHLSFCVKVKHDLMSLVPNFAGVQPADVEQRLSGLNDKPRF